MKTPVIRAPHVGDLPAAPDAIDHRSVIEHKSRMIAAGQFFSGSSVPRERRISTAAYANAAAWELWLAREAEKAQDTSAWTAHILSALSCATEASDWRMVNELAGDVGTAERLDAADPEMPQRVTKPLCDEMARAMEECRRFEAFSDPLVDYGLLGEVMHMIPPGHELVGESVIRPILRGAMLNGDCSEASVYEIASALKKNLYALVDRLRLHDAEMQLRGAINEIEAMLRDKQDKGGTNDE